ncbi:MAG TPA: hypothetical protein DDY62_00665 [Cryomorphaceae bacterium]|nr:hypothetical protein [Cryomorphaceae bacterium]
MKKTWILGLVACLLSACSYPYAEDLTRLETDTDAALASLKGLYAEGIEADYADLERHASIARTKRFDSVHEPYFRNEFEVLKYHYRQTSRWFELQSYAEWEAQLTYGLEQIRALKHDAEKGLLDEEAVRQALESEKNALLPLVAEIETSCAAMRELMAQHDSLDNHWQMMWDRWENPNL